MFASKFRGRGGGGFRAAKISAASSGATMQAKAPLSQPLIRPLGAGEFSQRENFYHLWWRVLEP
jgi:hypothetical protein